MASFKYRAFLSYSHRDTAWGKWLHAALEGYAVDKDLVGRETPVGPIPKTLRPIFRDREDFAAGPSLPEQTIVALEASQFLIVICSPNSAQSKYVNEEIRRFKTLGRGHHIIPVIVDGEPNDPERECFPPALCFKVGPDGTLTDEREEPIAADARPEHDGKDVAKLKVVAGLLGFGLDEIVRRAERARRKRVRNWSTALLLLTVTFAGLAVFAEINRREAERQRNHAEQETIKAERRSAMIATKFAQSLASEGSLDSALLLMLSAARWFDDESVPDEVRIAFSRALEKKSRIEVNTLFPNMQIFETDSALILVNPKTNDIFKLTDSLYPSRIYEGSAADSPIITVEQSANGDEAIIVRKSLEVQRINLTNGALRKVGDFPKPKVFAGRLDDDPELKISNSGLIVREFSFSNSQEGIYAQIMDPDTGHLLEGKLPSGAVYGKTADGKVFLFDRDKKKLYSLNGDSGILSLQATPFDERKNGQWFYGGCVGGMKEAVRKVAIKEVRDDIFEFFGLGFKCRKFGDKYLLTMISEGSRGATRKDALIDPDNPVTINSDPREILSTSLTETGSVSPNNFTWVGLQAETGAIGAVLNRDVYVSEDYSIKLNFRHPTMPTSARFIGHDRLVVVEGESGRLVVHDFGPNPRKEASLFSTPTNAIIGTQEPIATLHHGTCVGYALDADSDVMPDGRKVIYDVASPTSANDKQEIRVVSDKDTVVVKLDADTRCMQFSGDWKQMLVVKPTGVSVYEFDRVISSRSLVGNENATIAVSNPGSAFFVGQTGGVITTDGNRVLLWKREGNDAKWVSTEVFHGENEIIYAEPDGSGEQLLLIETRGLSTVRGFLYSVRARQEWFDLGEDYKWLGTAFTNNHEVVVLKGTWTNVFRLLPLSQLVELANKELARECRPVKQGDYRSSPCWPASLI